MNNYLSHAGRKGMKWYRRFHQSYKTKPTRSGKIGQEYGKAAEQSSRGPDNTLPNGKKRLTKKQKEYIGYNKPELIEKYKDNFTSEEIRNYTEIRKNLNELNRTLNTKKTNKQKLKDFDEIFKHLSSILQSGYSAFETINKGYNLLNKIANSNNKSNTNKAKAKKKYIPPSIEIEKKKKEYVPPLAETVLLLTDKSMNK